MVMGLTTGLWVSAQVRICDRAFIPATVVRRGDPDAGTVLLKLNRFELGVTVYTQASSMGDGPAWSRARPASNPRQHFSSTVEPKSSFIEGWSRRPCSISKAIRMVPQPITCRCLSNGLGVLYRSPEGPRKI